jgi:hypothetical protein
MARGGRKKKQRARRKQGRRRNVDPRDLTRVRTTIQPHWAESGKVSSNGKGDHAEIVQIELRLAAM